MHSTTATHTDNAKGISNEVVVVDDDQDILAIISDVLREEGYLPVPFQDGSRAEAYVSQHRPALVLTDLRLPIMSGRDLVRRLRECCGDDLPIVVMSGLADDAIAEHLPVQSYLHKPFELDELVRVIDRWRAWPRPEYCSASGQGADTTSG